MCLCLLCYRRDGNKCYLHSCDCYSELQYTQPDYLEITDRYNTTNTWYSRSGHRQGRTWYYSCYSKKHLNWTDSLEENRNYRSYRSRSKLIEKLLGGVHFPTLTWISGYYYGLYWIGLGVVICRDGMLHSVTASGY